MTLMSLDNPHKLALPYWARPGVRLFAKPADGGGKDDDDAEDGDDDDDEDDDNDADEDADKDEATLRAELKATRASLAAAQGATAAARRKRQSLRGELDKVRRELANRGRSKKTDDEDEPEGLTDADLDNARAEGQRASEAKAIKAAARSALKAAGASADNLGDLVRLIDMDDLELDEDGDVDGLEDEVARLRTRHPSLFAKAKPRSKRKIGGDGEDDERDGNADKRSVSQRQADAILGR